jgi:hypothetical protein
MRAVYLVQSRHGNWPAGNGEFSLTVESEELPEESRVCGVNHRRYVHGGPFGCSRDYFVTSDREAIARLLAEHACEVVRVRKGGR